VGQVARLAKRCIRGFGKRLLRKSKSRWKDNDKVDLEELEWGGIERINLAQDWESWRTLVTAIMKLQVP
jgi:hypothetical protein